VVTRFVQTNGQMSERGCQTAPKHNMTPSKNMMLSGC